MLRYNYTERQASAAAVASPFNPLCTWWRFPWRLETGLGPIFKHQPGLVLTAAAAAAARCGYSFKHENQRTPFHLYWFLRISGFYSHFRTYNFISFILLPPANEVWGKVIFSEACVKNSVHGVCLVPGGVETPRDGYCCGRYASYWNAFLFFYFFRRFS